MPARTFVWRTVEIEGLELARVEVDGTRLRATGRAIRTEPEPYVLTYALETGQSFVTTRLAATAEFGDRTKTLDLVRRDDGVWTANGQEAVSGGGLEGSLDCDLGLSPLTNTMPILRHGLHRGGGPEGPIDFVMAWVSVPDLTVHVSGQRYTSIGPAEADHRIVRYEEVHRDYVGDIEVDGNGFVVHYPELAVRVAAT
jgi:hypothetical protein